MAEWVGGCISAPLYVLEGEPQRPDVVLWLEVPSGLVVGTRLDAPPAPYGRAAGR
jgi:hypothetical protein